jgi:uncharacterized protein YndB with AHSA1/START domain
VNRRDQQVDGELEQSDEMWRLRFTRRLPHPPDKVWRALTEPQHLAAWFPTDIEGERRAGAPLRFVFRNGEGPAVEGEMLTYDPPSILEFRWGGGETLRFELKQDGQGTLLVFQNTIDQRGKAARDAAGWHACLDILEYHLRGEGAPWSPAERWKQVHDGYVERFGADAATIGPPGAGSEAL